MARRASWSPLKNTKKELGRFLAHSSESARSKILLKYVVFISLFFYSVSSSAAENAWLQQEARHMRLVTGVLLNQDYGFSIRPVQNVSAYVTAGGDGNHGALFVLGRYRTITFSADYAGFVTGDDEPCNPSQLSWIPARIGKVMTTSVDGHPACVTDFEKGDRAWRVLQVRGNDRGTEIMYTLAMTTSEDFIQSDSRVFDLITKNIRWTRIDP